MNKKEEKLILQRNGGMFNIQNANFEEVTKKLKNAMAVVDSSIPIAKQCIHQALIIVEKLSEEKECEKTKEKK